ncbi:glycosyltransferase family 2 protein [Acidiplasma sp.]|jgi:cellulose synthase (UDP-forming)|uniref:glycosyltransferase family 2 protein n=1 Tax=Acidiplasma sp. TaxID=1872114 RepID=UPI00258D5A88|nr:glycosyltransferase family 2 protein [Acidiplasma sp.]
MKKYSFLMNIITLLSIIFIFIGIFSLGYSIIILHYSRSIITFLFSFYFWLATLFFGIQSLALMLSYRRSKYKYSNTVPKSNIFLRSHVKKIAVLVPIYNEDKDMVARNLMAIHSSASQMVTLYILDDSTNNSSEAIKEIANRIDAVYIHRTDRSGYKAGALNNALKNFVNEEYVSVIDIDQMPSHDFIKEVVALLDNNEDVAFVQLPQYYANTDANVLAEMAQAQQFMFYEILTEGKSISGSLFSCGTNVIYRKSALAAVNYFDETNLIEDMATSINMISMGYRGLYYNKKLVYGRAPVTMEGYVNQQYRWAAGSIGLIKRIFKNILFKRKYSLAMKIDWLATSLWYLFGWFYLIFLLSPLFNIFGIYVSALNIYVYLLAWILYPLILTMTFVLVYMDRGAPLKSVFYNLAANLILFPISISATFGVIFKGGRSFKTARTGGKLPWYKFSPQIIIMIVLFVASSMLVYKGGILDIITAFWGFYQFVLLTPVFVLNRASKESSLDSSVLKTSPKFINDIKAGKDYARGYKNNNYPGNQNIHANKIDSITDDELFTRFK